MCAYAFGVGDRKNDRCWELGKNMWKSSKDLKKGKKSQFAWENLKLWTQINVERMVVLAGFRSFEKQSKKNTEKNRTRLCEIWKNKLRDGKKEIWQDFTSSQIIWCLFGWAFCALHVGYVLFTRTPHCETNSAVRLHINCILTVWQTGAYGS